MELNAETNSVDVRKVEQPQPDDKHDDPAEPEKGRSLAGVLLRVIGRGEPYSVSIHGELADGLREIMADRVGLQQVLMNLMPNGVQAMNDMIMSRRSEDCELAVSILDTGVGIPPEQIDQIFSAFITSKPQGTGMGLPISRSIIESHGGRLWATLIPRLVQHFNSSCLSNPRHRRLRNSGTRQAATSPKYHSIAARRGPSLQAVG
jgi:signal transduction histidine kinase